MLVGLEWKGLRCHRRASPSTVKNTKIENPEKYSEKAKHREKKTKYKKKRRNTAKIRRSIARRTQSIEKETKKQ